MNEKKSCIVSEESVAKQSPSGSTPPSSSTSSYHTVPSFAEDVNERGPTDSSITSEERSLKLIAILQHPLQADSSNTTARSKASSSSSTSSSSSSDTETAGFQSAQSHLDLNELNSSTNPLISELEHISFGCLNFNLDTYLCIMYLLFGFLVTVPTAHFFLGGQTDSVPTLLSRIIGWFELAILLVFALCLCQLLVTFLQSRRKTKMQCRAVQMSNYEQRVERGSINENSTGVAMLQSIQMGQVANQLDWNFHSGVFDV